MEQVTHPELEKTIRVPVLGTTEARQGETSGHVRVILASSLALAALVFIVLYGIWVTCRGVSCGGCEPVRSGRLVCIQLSARLLRRGSDRRKRTRTGGRRRPLSGLPV